LAATLAVATACRGLQNPQSTAGSGATLAVGVAQLSSTSPISGLRQLSPLFVLESLGRAGDDGRMQPALAESWTIDNANRSIVVTLKPHVKFQDGSPFDAGVAAALLPDIIRSYIGPLYEDIETITATSPSTLAIKFRRPSSFLTEAMEATIRKPGPAMVGTGPFMVEGNSTTELRANKEYYLGSPAIDRITVSNYPSLRAAWAELLRNRIDMLYEVGTEALDSMKNSSTVSLFTYTRHYQHVIIFNTRSAALKSVNVRRALNYGVDRQALIRNALREHGIVSTGPVSPRHWALAADSPHFNFDPQRAAVMLGSAKGARLRFTCLVSSDTIAERIALDVKQQLAGIGVDMVFEEADRETIQRRAGQSDYEAAVIETISGPTLIRPYLIWHTAMPVNWGNFGSVTTDEAFDRVRYAETEADYRHAVTGLQQAFMDDPPAMFLAWSVGTRAFSKRFEVPAEEGRDVLSTLRLWKPATARQQAIRN
jgi:peptide/nickel transport system substrate-binding protein